MNLFDIKNTKELVIFATSLVNNADKAMADGKVSLTDSTLLFEPIRKAGPAIDDLHLVPAELSDLDELEGAELNELVKQELDLRDDIAEEITEDVIVLAVQIALVLRKIRTARTMFTENTETPEV